MGRAPPRVKISPSRVNVEASVTGPYAHDIQAGQASLRSTTSKGAAQNARAARAASCEHLMRMMEVVAQMKGKTYKYQREALI